MRRFGRVPAKLVRIAPLFALLLCNIGIARNQCELATQALEAAQQRELAGEIATAEQAVTECDAFDTEVFLARVRAARHEWAEARAAYGRARGIASRDMELVSQIDMELAVMSSQQGPACEAVAAFDAVAMEVKERGQQLPGWFTKQRLAVEAEWTRAGLSSAEISCALNARRASSRALRASDTRLFCNEVELDIPVQFATDSWALDAKAIQQVNALAQALLPLIEAGDQIRLDGHTDERGADSLNQPLSEHRAGAVAAALGSRLRLPAARLHAVGHGKQDPKYNVHTLEAYRLNRRVEVTLVPAGCAS